MCKCHTKPIGLCANLEEEGKGDEEKEGGRGILAEKLLCESNIWELEALSSSLVMTTQ